jgi:hypothetical protein
MRVLRRHNAELNLLQRVAHKMAIQFEMGIYSYIYILPNLAQVFIKGVTL